ncbi:MAG TPA: hypothetical protein VMT85_16555 [Thermoanaerobaculia bacterium]|nr:hypothetical protein [Thermoanaerobaculia bacterium]
MNHTIGKAPTFDPSDPSPLHAALQELESLLSGVAILHPESSVDPDTGRARRSANADDERADTGLAERLLDVAAGLASLHPGLHHKRLLVRSLLAWEAAGGSVAVALRGEPRAVLSAEDLTSEREARLRGESIARIWEEEMLEPSAAAVALGTKATNRQRIADLRQRSTLLGLRHGRGYVFPAFQFDLPKRRIRPEVEAVNQAFDAATDPWGVASWWISPNGRLGGDRPMDLVGTDRSHEIVSAADALLEPIG